MKKQSEIIEEEADDVPCKGSKTDEFILVNGKRYVKDKPIDGDVVKMQVGDVFQGLLSDRYPSKTYDGKMIYKFRQKNDIVPKILLGTTMLDRVMQPYDVGSEVVIKRLDDIETGKGNPLQQYVTYHPEEA